MTLTVPRAGVIGGAAPSLRFERDTTGDSIAAFGERMFEVGAQIKADRLDRQMKRAQVNFTRDMGELRNKFDQMGDPDEIDAQWSAGVAEIKDRHRAALDPENAEQFDLTSDDLSNRHTFAVGRHAIGLRNSQRLATWGDYRTVAVQQAVLLDPQTREALYQQGDQQLDGLVSQGIMSAEKAAEEKRQFRAEVENTRIIDQVADRPEEFLADADAGTYGTLPPERLAQYRVQANAKIAAKDAQALSQAKLDQKAQDTLIGNRLSDIGDIAKADRVAVDEDFMALPEVQAHPNYPKAMAAIALRNERADLPYMNPEQLDHLIAQEEAKPLNAPFQAERLQALTAQRDAASTGWGHDPMAYAGKSGFSVPAMPDLASATPDEIGAAIQARVAFSEGLQEGGFTSGRADPLTLDEREDMNAALSVNADPARRAELAKALAVSGAGNLIQDPALSHVAGLLANGGNDALGRAILRGQQVLDQNNIVMPPLADRLSPAFDQIGALFADSADGEAAQASVIAATDALYASRQRRVDPAAPIDEPIYKQALHEVLGGTGTFDADTATGGVATISGRPTALPMGISKRAVERASVALHRDLNGIGRSGGPTAEPSARVQQGLESLRQISVGGGVPTIGGEVMDAGDWGDAEFVATGPDEYQVVISTQGGPITALDDATGEPFTFSMKSLTRRYGQ